jgi:hypothetical protein
MPPQEQAWAWCMRKPTAHTCSESRETSLSCEAAMSLSRRWSWSPLKTCGGGQRAV